MKVTKNVTLPKIIRFWAQIRMVFQIEQSQTSPGW
jgi:hypothetical protein